MMHLLCRILFFVYEQKTAYVVRISDWSSDVCSSDLISPQITHQLSELGKRNNETIGHRAGPYSCVIPAQTGIHERRSGQVRTGPCPRNPAFAGMTQSFNKDRKSTRLNSSH